MARHLLDNPENGKSFSTLSLLCHYCSLLVFIIVVSVLSLADICVARIYAYKILLNAGNNSNRKRGILNLLNTLYTYISVVKEHNILFNVKAERTKLHNFVIT